MMIPEKKISITKNPFGSLPSYQRKTKLKISMSQGTIAPVLLNYRFRLVNVKRGLASKGQIRGIVEEFFALTGLLCEFEINYVEKLPITYIWFEDVEIAEKFLKGSDLTISQQISDPNWVAPKIPLKEAKEKLISDTNWDQDATVEEMNYDEPLQFGDASSSSSSPNWADRVEPLTLEDKITALESSYSPKMITIQVNVGHFLRFPYSPEQMERARRDSYLSGDRHQIPSYGSIVVEPVDPAWLLNLKPVIHNVIVNTAIPEGTTEEDIRKMLRKFATTPTVTIKSRTGPETVPSPHIHFLRSKNGKGLDQIIATFDPDTHDAFVACQMRAYFPGVKLSNGKQAIFAWKMKPQYIPRN